MVGSTELDMQVIRAATIIGLLLLAQAAQAQIRVPAPLVVPTVPVIPAPIIPPPLISPPSLEVPVLPVPDLPPAARSCPEGASVSDCPGDRSIQKNEGMGVLGPSIAR
jgi:hypothetical protein